MLHGERERERERFSMDGVRGISLGLLLVCRRPKLSLPFLPAGVGRARGRQVCGMSVGPRAMCHVRSRLFHNIGRLAQNKNRSRKAKSRLSALRHPFRHAVHGPSPHAATQPRPDVGVSQHPRHLAKRHWVRPRLACPRTHRRADRPPIAAAGTIRTPEMWTRQRRRRAPLLAATAARTIT